MSAIEEVRAEFLRLNQRIIDLEAEIARHDTMEEVRRKRTIEAQRLWQRETGHPDVWPDLGELVAWLVDRGDAYTRIARAALCEYHAQGMYRWIFALHEMAQAVEALTPEQVAALGEVEETP